MQSPRSICRLRKQRRRSEKLEAEDKIGLMLPCNVIVQRTPDGKTEVAAVDPLASMQAVENDALKPIAEDVRDRLRRVISSLEHYG